MTGILHGKQPWATLGSAALGLGLYYLYLHRIRETTSHSTISRHLTKENCQDYDDATHVPDAMDPEERAYHEGFMREAIAMVRQTLHPLAFGASCHCN